MNIVSWNCNGKFRKKYKHLLEYNCDIMIIQECENPEVVKYSEEFKALMPHFIWKGDNKNKGLAIFSKYNLTDNDWYNGETKYFISCKVNDDFNLLGVWCHQANSPTFEYIGQMWKYMQINKRNMRNIDLLICGDFNSNKIWHIWDRWWNHSDVFKEFDELDIRSLYHQYYNEEQGEETIPTLYHTKKLKKRYHIDYMLGSKRLYNSLSSFIIGTPKKWLKPSDHMPIFIVIK